MLAAALIQAPSSPRDHRCWDETCGSSCGGSHSSLEPSLFSNLSGLSISIAIEWAKKKHFPKIKTNCVMLRVPAFGLESKVWQNKYGWQSKSTKVKSKLWVTGFWLSLAAKRLNNQKDGGWEKDVASPQSCHGDNYFILCLGISGTLALASQAFQSIRNVCYLLRKQRERHRRKVSGGFSISRECANCISPQIFWGFQNWNENSNVHL